MRKREYKKMIFALYAEDIYFTSPNNKIRFLQLLEEYFYCTAKVTTASKKSSAISVSFVKNGKIQLRCANERIFNDIHLQWIHFDRAVVNKCEYFVIKRFNLELVTA